jgi:hypothetical protein
MVDMKFVLAGKAVFTVDNGKGEHFTYKITKHKDKNMYFANVLSGGDGVYSYMGIFDTTRFNVVKGNKGIESTCKSVKVLEWAIRVVRGVSALPVGYDIMHSNMCGRCGRDLTDSESIRTGLGSTCRNK